MPELFLSWSFWYAVGGAVVVVAAALLVIILVTARGIEKEATRALEAARRVERNTEAIAALGGARDVLEGIRTHVDAIEAKTGALASALGGDAEAREPAEREWER